MCLFHLKDLPRNTERGCSCSVWDQNRRSSPCNCWPHPPSPPGTKAPRSPDTQDEGERDGQSKVENYPFLSSEKTEARKGAGIPQAVLPPSCQIGAVPQQCQTPLNTGVQRHKLTPGGGPEGVIHRGMSAEFRSHHRAAKKRTGLSTCCTFCTLTNTPPQHH